jgi:radical SAM superfamily enzyme YgiQ (UPF0313 family)
MRIYLINPKNPDNFWTMQSSVKAVGCKTLMPNAALATLVALTPKDADVEYTYCDENVSSLDLGAKCDLVAVTGYTLHSKRIREISDAFRNRDVAVALGGAFATLNPKTAKELADHLFIGEAEYTWAQFLRDWAYGQPRPLYEQNTHVDIRDSPSPDWSLINGSDYLNFSVQTNRGCPHNCDFCDAVRLVGRKVRTKTIDQVMTEIDNAHAAGAEAIFFSEDNFFARPAFTKELLTEIVRWNTSVPSPLSFYAQSTLTIAEDEEILQLLADARFSGIFLGVESIHKECLDEVNKGHIFRSNAGELLLRLSTYGIVAFLGLIVGFDHDDESTFDQIEEFLIDTATPLAFISFLNAPADTPLYRRMKEQGRLSEDFDGLWHFSTNIIPARMPLYELISRNRRLLRRLYDPKEFEQRILNWLSNVKYFTPLYRDSKTSYSKLFKLFDIMKFCLFQEPAPVRRLFFRTLRRTWRINPRLVRKAVILMMYYWNFFDYFVKDTSWQNMEQ